MHVNQVPGKVNLRSSLIQFLVFDKIGVNANANSRIKFRFLDLLLNFSKMCFLHIFLMFFY